MFIRRKFKIGQRVEVRFVHERYDHVKGEYIETAQPEWLPGTFVEYDDSGNRKVNLDDGRHIGFNVLWKIRPVDPGLPGKIFYYR